MEAWVAVQLVQVGSENMGNTIVIPWAVTLLTNLNCSFASGSHLEDHSRMAFLRGSCGLVELFRRACPIRRLVWIRSIEYEHQGYDQGDYVS